MLVWAVKQDFASKNKINKNKKITVLKPRVMAHTYNPSTEPGTYTTFQGQPGLYNELYASPVLQTSVSVYIKQKYIWVVYTCNSRIWDRGIKLKNSRSSSAI